jgi:hypothetical protein
VGLPPLLCPVELLYSSSVARVRNWRLPLLSGVHHAKCDCCCESCLLCLAYPLHHGTEHKRMEIKLEYLIAVENYCHERQCRLCRLGRLLWLRQVTRLGRCISLHSGRWEIDWWRVFSATRQYVITQLISFENCMTDNINPSKNLGIC